MASAFSKTPKQSSQRKKKRHSSAGDVTPKLEDFGSPGFLERIYNIDNARAAAAAGGHADSMERDGSDTNLFKVPATVNKWVMYAFKYFHFVVITAKNYR